MNAVYSIVYEVWFKVVSSHYDDFGQKILVCSNKTFDRMLFRECEVI